MNKFIYIFPKLHETLENFKKIIIKTTFWFYRNLNLDLRIPKIISLPKHRGLNLEEIQF